MKQYIITGMTCASCQSHVEKAVRSLKNVESASVSLLTNTLSVEGSACDEEVIAAVEAAGYGASLKYANQNKLSESERLKADEKALEDKNTPILKRRMILSIVFLVLLMYITMGHNMLGLPLPLFMNGNYIGTGIIEMLLAMAVIIVNKAFFVSGFKSLSKGSPNMDTLVALGSGVSFIWSLYILLKMTVMMRDGAEMIAVMHLYHNQLYFESAAMIPALITVGKLLESISKGKTTDALKNLLKMAPKKAVAERNGKPVLLDIDEVVTGDILQIKPGESIPADGIVIEGMTAVDESALTGESIPVDKKQGDSVSAATINRSGFIRIQTVRVGEDTSFSQIIQMVSNAASTKAPIARIADKVSAVFVPAVIVIALIVLAGWILAGSDISIAIEHAVTVLVISCPCALGLATPVAIMAGSGKGAQNGILYKTAASLEMAGKVQIAVVDKTGTITEGKPTAVNVIPAVNVEESVFLEKACALESKSEHPLAAAVTALAKEKNISILSTDNFKALPGNGLQSELNGKKVFGGSVKYVSSMISINKDILNKASEFAEEGRTPILFGEDDKYLGMIAVADVIKDDSAEAICEMRNMGIEVVMLTGDNERTAAAIGRQAGVDRVIAGVLPEGKEAVIRDMMKRGTTAMIGDGINDAPALKRSDLGIAIGAGSDAAIDSGDVVLMNSRLSDAAGAVRLGRAVLRNIYENLFWAFAYNIVLIPIAAGFYPRLQINPMWGAAAMSLSSFTVCMNALRLNIFKIDDSSHDRIMKHRKLHDAETVKTVMAVNAAGGNTTVCPIENRGENMIKKTVKIEGMMCEHCAAAVKNALEELDGIESAEVSVKDGSAVIEMSKNVDSEKIKKAIEDRDYKFISIE